MKRKEAQIINTEVEEDVAIFVENLLNTSWYTADPKRPFLVKAASNVQNGYQILITDLKDTYFCAGDSETIKNDKKVRSFIESKLIRSLIQQLRQKNLVILSIFFIMRFLNMILTQNTFLKRYLSLITLYIDE